jgi:FixJ family two-component response regulator
VSIRDALARLIRSVALSAEAFGSVREFLAHQRPDALGCLALDVRMLGLSGLDLQREHRLEACAVGITPVPGIAAPSSS